VSKSKSRQRSRKGESPPAPAASAAIGRSDAARRFYAILSAFLAGAAVMVMELAGNRVLAPWFGNSLYTWTGLIGVVLVSISGGYYLGGYLADRRPDYVMLAHLMGLAALLTAAVPLIQTALEGPLESASVLWGPVIAALLLFAVPGCLMASVSPFAIRLVSLLSRDRNVGLSAGSVGMFATLGSVLGTFAAGFVLIPLVGVRTIFLVIALGMGLLAAAGYVLFFPDLKRRKGAAALAVLVFAGMAAWASTHDSTPPAVLFEQTTFYHRIRVGELPTPDGDRHSKIFLDNTLEGAQYVHSRKLPSQYQRFWALARMFCPQVRTAAFLGGGGFAMPEALLDAYPEAQVDVVEIDPKVIEVGRRFFRLDEYPQLNAVADDARRFLRRTDARYDLILADVFHGVRCIPAHLVTREFFALVRSRLDDQGLFAFNLGTAVEGEHARIFQSVLKTLSAEFPYHCVFTARPDLDRRAIQNVYVVAALRDLGPGLAAARRLPADDPVHELLRGHLAPDQYDTSPGYLFTDDWNPLEYLAAQTLRTPPPDAANP